MSGPMSGVWRRSQGRTSEAPPNERGGNRYRPARPRRRRSKRTEVQRGYMRQVDLLRTHAGAAFLWSRSRCRAKQSASEHERAPINSNLAMVNTQGTRLLEAYVTPMLAEEQGNVYRRQKVSATTRRNKLSGLSECGTPLCC